MRADAAWLEFGVVRRKPLYRASSSEYLARLEVPAHEHVFEQRAGGLVVNRPGHVGFLAAFDLTDCATYCL
ncbi:hypothetical protein D3C81_2113220 [compost metagenome]